MDVVSQGYTKKNALINLLNCIAIEIDYVIINNNFKNFIDFLKKQKTKKR